MRNKTICVVLACGLTSAPAMADWFGGAEAGWTRDTNFTGAPAGATKTEENIAGYSLYLGHFTPLANKRSAFIVKADAGAARMDTFDVLDSESFGASMGLFHGFSRMQSMTATVGGNARRFDDPLRATEAYYAQLGFKQKLANSFWSREGAVYDAGKAKSVSAEYTGVGVNGSLNWAPAKSTLFILGAGWNERDYNVTVANKRTSTSVSLGLVQQLGAVMYVRLGATALTNKTNAGSEYDTVLYSVGLGLAL